MKPVAYPRVSTDDQRNQKTIQTQLEEIERHCQRLDVPLGRVYPDDGVSATIPFDERPGGKLLLRDARLGRFDTVLVYAWDRVGREVEHNLRIIRELGRLGIAIVSISESYDPNDEDGKVMFTVASVFAERERLRTLKRGRDGLYRVVRRGAWISGIRPFGYQIEGKKEEARLFRYEERIPGLSLSEVDAVALGFEMVGRQKKTTVDVAVRWNELSIPTVYVRDGRLVKRKGSDRKEPTSGEWTASQVHQILTSPLYMGVHVYHTRHDSDQPQITRSVPAIVSEELWQATQQLIQQNRLENVKPTDRKYLLHGLITCALCGKRYFGMVKKNRHTPDDPTREVRYYICRNRCNGGRGVRKEQRETCPSKIIRASIEAVVWQDIEHWLRNPGEVAQRLEERYENRRQDLDGLQERLTRSNQELATFPARRKRFRDLYSTGGCTRPEYDADLLDLQQRQEEKETERQQLLSECALIEDAQRRIAGSVDHLEQIRANLDRLPQADEALAWALKREVVKDLVESIRVETVGTGRYRPNAVVTIRYRFGACHVVEADPGHGGSVHGESGWAR